MILNRRKKLMVSLIITIIGMIMIYGTFFTTFASSKEGERMVVDENYGTNDASGEVVTIKSGTNQTITIGNNILGYIDPRLVITVPQGINLYYPSASSKEIDEIIEGIDNDGNQTRTFVLARNTYTSLQTRFVP